MKEFQCFTSDLERLSKWLKNCGVKTVVMESTGVYWIPCFQILETHGFEVKLVNARHVKNVPGRKTDVQDCQWLQKLHMFGLLAGSFRPEDQICVLRSYVRHRSNLIKSNSTHIQRMQKALDQMNVQVHKAVSDMTGLTGMSIIKAILSGERNPKILAKYRHPLVRKSEEEIAEFLNGDYREEHFFSLQQEYDLFCIYNQKIEDCDKKISAYYDTFEHKIDLKENPLKKSKKKKKGKNEPSFNLRENLYQITGVDLTLIDGLDVLGLQTILSEVGTDPSKWPTEKHFVSWLGLAPYNEISGGKILKRGTKKVVNRAATMFRLGAHALLRSESALGAYYRRLRQRIGAQKAITATARKIACIFYRMLKYGQDYVDQGMDYYEKKYKDRVLKNLKRTAKNLGYELTSVSQSV